MLASSLASCETARTVGDDIDRGVNAACGFTHFERSGSDDGRQ